MVGFVNKAVVMGNLGADPNTRYMPDGTAVATISVATTSYWKDKLSNERREKVEWHRIVFFNKLAETVSKYLKKGDSIYVEGKLQTRKWTAEGEELR